MKVKDVLKKLNYGRLQQKVFIRKGLSEPKEVTKSYFFDNALLAEDKCTVMSIDLTENSMIINYVE